VPTSVYASVDAVRNWVIGTVANHADFRDTPEGAKADALYVKPETNDQPWRGEKKKKSRDPKQAQSDAAAVVARESPPPPADTAVAAAAVAQKGPQAEAATLAATAADRRKMTPRDAAPAAREGKKRSPTSCCSSPQKVAPEEVAQT
jgi:hypothetical protein